MRYNLDRDSTHTMLQVAIFLAKVGWNLTVLIKMVYQYLYL